MAGHSRLACESGGNSRQRISAHAAQTRTASDAATESPIARERSHTPSIGGETLRAIAAVSEQTSQKRRIHAHAVERSSWPSQFIPLAIAIPAQTSKIGMTRAVRKL